MEHEGLYKVTQKYLVIVIVLNTPYLNIFQEYFDICFCIL